MYTCIYAGTLIIVSAYPVLVLASSPGFSLLPRNDLCMTFDPPGHRVKGHTNNVACGGGPANEANWFSYQTIADIN